MTEDKRSISVFILIFVVVVIGIGTMYYFVMLIDYCESHPGEWTDKKGPCYDVTAYCIQACEEFNDIYNGTVTAHECFCENGIYIESANLPPMYINNS